MGKVDNYKNILINTKPWDQYLLKESNLPGPRANLELLQAVVEVGDEATFTRYVALDPEKAPTNSPEEFLAMCGIVGLGKLVCSGRQEFLETLRRFAADKRWRIREGVAIALQHLGESNIDLLLGEMAKWKEGSLLERRAAVAALCEPKLLTDETVPAVQNIIDCITLDVLAISDRKEENFKTLRKALGYGWSVVVVANPASGKCLMEKWFASEDKDILWIMRENLRKDRMNRMDKDWTRVWKKALGVS